jgi:hypothetical protein
VADINSVTLSGLNFSRATGYKELLNVYSDFIDITYAPANLS